jgi:hypothetical protein
MEDDLVQPKGQSVSLEYLLMAEAQDLATGLRIQFLLERLNAYSQAARRQCDRVTETHLAAWRVFREGEPNPEFTRLMRHAVVEAHFYFIIWDAVRKCLDSIRKAGLNLTTPRELIRRYRTTLDAYSRARNHLEHYAERLPGMPKSSWEIVKTESGQRAAGHTASVGGWGFSFEGEHWEITPENADLLVRIVDEFCNGLRQELEPAFWNRLSEKPDEDPHPEVAAQELPK